jgi:hypothetical protein
MEIAVSISLFVAMLAAWCVLPSGATPSEEHAPGAVAPQQV